MKSLRARFLLMFLFSAIISKGISQVANEPNSISEIAEELAADDNDPEAAATFTGYLSELAENPVRINSADENELSRLFFLSGFQVKSLAGYVRNTGSIVSVNEIASITGFDSRIAQIMIPFITLSASPASHSDSISVHCTLISNFIFKPGENDTTLNGSLMKNLTKFRVSAGRYSAGFTAEKDAGEKFLTGSPPLPDFLSFYSSFSGRGFIRRIILGDYALRLGEGTGINTSMRTGLSLTQPGFTGGRDNLKPYTSTDENNFFRGVAAEISLLKSTLIVFYSSNKIDASTIYGNDTADLFISGLYKAGVHNTSSLMTKKDNVNETVFGMNFSIDSKYIRAGFNWSETRFSIPFRSEPDNPLTIYNFNGSRNSIFSANYCTMAGRILLSGEFSLDNKMHYALLQGAVIRASDRLSLNFMYHNYSPGFTAFNGNGPGSGTTTGNEEGLTANLSFEAARHLFILAGTDLTRYPWLRYRCDFPSISRRHEALARWLPSEKISIELSYSYRFTMVNDNSGQGVAAIGTSTSHTLKCFLRYAPDENSTFTTRLAFRSASPSRSTGALLLQDVYLMIPGTKISLWVRWCMFKTETWDSRLYMYENDLLYNFSIPALSGEGSRSYAMVKFNIGRFTEMRVKYGITSLVVPGMKNVNNDELKLQLRAWF